MARGEDINKVFMMEVRDKKRIGSNIFSRVSTRKGGGNQALRTPYYFMSNKDKKKMNGEVTIMNMNTVLPLNDFQKLDEKLQKEMMLTWRKNYTAREIKEKMGGVTDYIFYKQLSRLGIKVNGSTNQGSKAKKERKDAYKYTVLNNQVVTKEKMEEYKKDIVSYKTLLSLNYEQRLELIEAYEKELNIPEIANVMGVQKNSLYKVKSDAKKQIKKQEEVLQEEKVVEKGKNVAITETPYKEDDNEGENNPVQTKLSLSKNKDTIEQNDIKESVSVEEKSDNLSENVDIQEIQEKMNDIVNKYNELLKEKEEQNEVSVVVEEPKEQPSFFFNVNKTDTGKNIFKKISKVLSLLEDEDDEFTVEFTIKGK